MIDPQNLDQLQEAINAMQWDTVKLAPDAEDVQALDQQLPDAWLSELDREQAFDREILDTYANMTEQDLHNSLDIPSGDIDNNAQQAIEELGIDIDALLQEMREKESEIAIEIEAAAQIDIDPQSDDFGR